jgi:transposase-like protein
MRERELTVLRKSLAKLTRTQRLQVVSELTADERQVASVAVIESARAHPTCPHCGAERIVKNGTAERRQRFKCRACTETFNALTGTPLAHLHQTDQGQPIPLSCRDDQKTQQSF